MTCGGSDRGTVSSRVQSGGWSHTKCSAAASAGLTTFLVAACCGPWDSESHMPTGVVAPAPRMAVAKVSPSSRMSAAPAPGKSTGVPVPRRMAAKVPPANSSPSDLQKVGPTTAKSLPAAPATAKSTPAEPASARVEAPISAIEAKVTKLAADLAGELSARCPFTGPADEAAFNDCQKALSGSSKIKASLAALIPWGPVGDGSGRRLVLSGMPELPSDDLAGKYLPLFMFSGRHEVAFSEPDKLYRIELGARFRNRLPPARFPDPVKEKDEAWARYQAANGIVFWVEPEKLDIRVGQFRPGSSVGNPPSTPAQRPAP
jgi:hypothetical protein